MKKIGIILINYNSWQVTKECLESLSLVETDQAELDIVLVDNASGQSIAKQFSDFKKRHAHLHLTLIENSENLGFAGGNNRGITHCMEHGADYIMLLNNDTIVDKKFIDPLVSFFEKGSPAGVISPKIYFAPGYEYHQERYKESEKGNIIWYAGGHIDWDNVYASHRGVDEVDIGRYNAPKKTGFISGCCFMVKQEVFEKIGLLDDAYFMYLEDVDFCVRAKRAGYELWLVPQSFIWHKNAQSSGKSGSSIHVYYQTRNRLLFGFKYASLRTKIALARDSMRIVARGGIRKEAVIDYYCGRMGRKEFHES